MLDPCFSAVRKWVKNFNYYAWASSLHARFRPLFFLLVKIAAVKWPTATSTSLIYLAWSIFSQNSYRNNLNFLQILASQANWYQNILGRVEIAHKDGVLNTLNCCFSTLNNKAHLLSNPKNIWIFKPKTTYILKSFLAFKNTKIKWDFF